jgi:thiol-disulfide isomerase/thioredoxin
MFGARLGKSKPTFRRPPAAFGGGGGGSGDLAWVENDLTGAFAQAKAGNKYVLVNFTGYACTNCHWMKANMFTKPEIAGVMKNMVLVDLYTDGTDAASVANQKLEEDKFQTVAIPFYVLYDANQNVLATFPGIDARFVRISGVSEHARRAAAPANGLRLIPTPALQHPFKTLDGAPISTADWKGKVVVLNYWATWCIPCRAEIPEFNKLHQDLASKGVEVSGFRWTRMARTL